MGLESRSVLGMSPEPKRRDTSIQKDILCTDCPPVKSWGDCLLNFKKKIPYGPAKAEVVAKEVTRST